MNEWKTNRRILATTATSASDLHLNCPFVFIDEGSQLTEIASLLPLVQTGAIRVLILGDSHQLAQPCTGDISESVLSVFSAKKLLAENFCLSTQFRCHESVANFCAKHFYHRPITTGKIRQELADLYPSLPPISILQHKFRADREPKSGSLHNDREIKLVVDYLLGDHRRFSRSQGVAIITFYCAQHACLVEALAVANLSHIQVHTVDSFQGSEADIVILSLVASDALRCEKFIANPNRLNVALSRAFHKLIVVGHSQIFEKICIFANLKSVAIDITQDGF